MDSAVGNRCPHLLLHPLLTGHLLRSVSFVCTDQRPEAASCLKHNAATHQTKVTAADALKRRAAELQQKGAVCQNSTLLDTAINLVGSPFHHLWYDGVGSSTGRAGIAAMPKLTVERMAPSMTDEQV
jgi:hypothetical protein